MDSPDSKFGKGLLIGGPLEVLQGVHSEDARCHQEPAHLMQEHLTTCSDSNGNGGNGIGKARAVLSHLPALPYQNV